MWRFNDAQPKFAVIRKISESGLRLRNAGMNHVFVLTCGALLAFLDRSSAADTSCFNISLPNILGLGECLGTTGDLCTSNSQGALDVIGNIVECALDGIRDLNFGSQLYLIIQFLVLAVDRSGLGIAVELLDGLCDLLASLVGTTCTLFALNETALCQDPIDLNLPSVIGVGECFGTQFQACEQGQLVTGGVVQILFNVIQCLLKNLNDQSFGSILENITCSVFNIINKITGTQIFGKLLNRIFRTNC